MKYILLFLILFANSISALSSKSILSRTPGEFIVSRNSTSTRDVALIMSDRHMRFNLSCPPLGIPTKGIGVFDIFTNTSSTKINILGFAEFREVTDPTSVLYNTSEASDPVGSHFFFGMKDTNLLLMVRQSANFAVTNNALIFGITGNVVAVSNTVEDPNASSYKLWIKGDSKLIVSGGIDGPTGGRVAITTDQVAYMTFTVETSSDAQKKWLIWTLNDNGLTLSRRFLIQDLTLTIPFSALGSSDVVKTFIIDHPTAPDRYLVHAAIEGPQNRVYYRGKTTLQHGQAFVALPDYFEGLTQEDHRAVFLQNMSGFDKLAVKTQDGKRIKNGVLHIVSQNKHSQAVVSWEVSAVRKDVPDLIVAPRIDEVDVLGFGPYRYVVPKE